MKTRKSKIMVAVLGIIMIVMSMSVVVPASAEEMTYGPWSYWANNNQITINKYNGSDTNVEIPSQIDGMPVTKIGQCSFMNCTSLQSITIPGNVKTIGEMAFAGCKALKTVTIEKGVVEIEQQAFWRCSSLETVTIPNSVTEISGIAFGKCTSLKTVDISDSVTKIMGDAFDECTSLKSITVDKNNQTYCDINGVVFNKTKTEICMCPNGLSDNYTIPDSVTKIGSSAFSSCASLKSIDIPDSVTKIGSCAFSNCASLKSVDVPDSVTEIDGYAFNDCSLLQSVNIPKSITKIDEYMFQECTSLKSINIPDNIAKICESAFEECTALEAVAIPNSVIEIHDKAFYNCPALKSVAIPDSVTKIGKSAFGYYKNDNSSEKIAGFTIYGHKGTYAEQYAFDKEFIFKVASDEEFTVPEVPTASATSPVIWIVCGAGGLGVAGLVIFLIIKFKK